MVTTNFQEASFWWGRGQPKKGAWWQTRNTARAFEILVIIIIISNVSCSILHPTQRPSNPSTYSLRCDICLRQRYYLYLSRIESWPSIFMHGWQSQFSGGYSAVLGFGWCSVKSESVVTKWNGPWGGLKTTFRDDLQELNCAENIGMKARTTNTLLFISTCLVNILYHQF